MSIMLPKELAELVRSKVASGQYASDSEVIREGLRALAEGDHAIERWLHDSVLPSYDALAADPSRARTIAQVLERLNLLTHTRRRNSGDASPCGRLQR